METLTPSTKIRSNTIYQIEGEISGTINVQNVNNVTFEGGRLRGGYNLTGVNNDINWNNTETFNGMVQVRSEGTRLGFYGCKLHDADYAVWLRASSGGYNSGVTFDNCQIYNTQDDGVYLYKVHGLTIENSLFHHANLKWKAPETSQKIAPGDGMQLILADRIRIENNTIDRSHTGNKFCLILSGTAGSQGTGRIPGNFIQINNNRFKMPIRTGQGGAGLYFYDLPADMVTEFTFNEVHGDLAAIKYSSLGTFLSNGNEYKGTPGAMPIAIELQNTAAKGTSISDLFINCTRKVTNNVQIVT